MYLHTDGSTSALPLRRQLVVYVPFLYSIKPLDLGNISITTWKIWLEGRRHEHAIMEIFGWGPGRQENEIRRILAEGQGTGMSRSKCTKLLDSVGIKKGVLLLFLSLYQYGMYLQWTMTGIALALQKPLLPHSGFSLCNIKIGCVWHFGCLGKLAVVIAYIVWLQILNHYIQMLLWLYLIFLGRLRRRARWKRWTTCPGHQRKGPEWTKHFVQFVQLVGQGVLNAA